MQFICNYFVIIPKNFSNVYLDLLFNWTGKDSEKYVGALFKILSSHFLAESKKTKKISVIMAVSRMRFELVTSRMRSRCSHYSNPTVGENGVKNNNFVARSGQIRLDKHD
jgi:hypothetical protein